jgi:SecD/SecF fusion protein
LKKVYGKILIIALPIVAAIFLLMPTYNASELQKKYDEAQNKAIMAKSPADSLEILETFDKEYGDAFKSAKKSRLKLGLDLRGGMYVTLEVDVLKLIEESANPNSKDEIFKDALDKTRLQIASSNEDAVDLFISNFDDAVAASGKGSKLSDYYEYNGRATDDNGVRKGIIDQMKTNETEAIDQAMLVFKQRFDTWGVSEITILKQGNRRIMVEVPGVSNEKDILSLLQTTARLEFKLVRNDEKTVMAFYNIDKLVSKHNKLKLLLGTGGDSSETGKINTDSSLLAKKDSSKVASDSSLAKESKATDSTGDSSKAKAEQADTANPYAGLSEDETRKRYQEDHPFTTLFETMLNPEDRKSRRQPINYTINSFPKGSYDFYIYEPGLKKYREILARPEVQELLPEGVQLLLSKPEKLNQKAAGNQDIRMWQIFALKKEAELKGDVITNAIATYDQNQNEPIVSMSMNSDGSEKWARITGENIKKRIAIVLDDQVYSAPVVQAKIIGGNSQITGVNTDEAKLLKTILNAGKLKVPVQIVEQRIVGPSLGEDSIRSGLVSMLLAAILVIIFMAMYYAFGGMIADFCVILHTIFIVAILAAFGGTLTLPGIAGIILTLGMAVDANILIYERIREELLKGRSIRSAVDEGYSKAMNAILDANVTTFLTGLILYFFGTGPIQGFAMTLMIGILSTLFTQIVVSRAIIELLLSRGITTLNVGQPKIIINQA